MTEETYHQRIKELLYDEEKVVTMLSLMESLGIDGDVKSSTLKNFYEKSKNSDLHPSFVVTGHLKENNELVICWVKGNELQQTKSLFNGTRETIYSLQKGKQIDFNSITTIDANLKCNKPPLICKNALKRRTLTNEIKKESVVQGSKIIPKIPKKDVKENGVNKIEEQTQPSQSKIKPKGGIANFFSQTSGNSDKNKKEIVKNIQTKNSQSDIDKKTNVKKELIADEPEVKVKPEEPTKPACEIPVVKQESKKRKSTNKNDGPNKKHKRILQIQDSDDDIFENNEDEDIIEMSDEELKPIQVSKPPPIPKNKKRKAVDKTYVDEEGFMVTTTEYVYESASEDEEKGKPEQKKLPSPKKQSEKNNAAPKTSSSKSKQKKGAPAKQQQTLMNFFKKA